MRSQALFKTLQVDPLCAYALATLSPYARSVPCPLSPYAFSVPCPRSPYAIATLTVYAISLPCPYLPADSLYHAPCLPMSSLRRVLY
eukprot:350201-Rhodomonas_salina.1